MKTQNAELIIFSVELSSNSRLDNQINTDQVINWMDLNNVPYQRVTGVYKGTSETSFVVPARFKRQIEAIARDYNQESILLRRHDLSCELYYLKTGQVEQIGQWTEIKYHEKSQYDGYTEELETNRFFTVKAV